MSSAPPAVSIGVDFGTSNTVVALATPEGRVEALRFSHGGQLHTVFVSALCFWQERGTGDLLPRAEGGPWAIARVLDDHGPHRFLQSFKSFAANRNFQSTIIFRQRFAFEDLLATFLRSVQRHADRPIDFADARVTIGRPVRFVGQNPDEALAMDRYGAAFGRLGAKKARYVYEPVGAAFAFARKLVGDATVLVADFGGGTSDFSLMRFARQGGKLRTEPLGHAGIGLAGDAFDARIVDRIVAPRLGKGGDYRSFGKVLPLPAHFYGKLSRWNELALMKGGTDLRDLRELARTALQPGPLEDFITLIENDVGLALHRAVSALKVALSGAEEAVFDFAFEGVRIAAPVSRAAFENWIAEDLARIGATIDAALETAGLAPKDVDRVFLTGGTSFVPAVQRLFVERFGTDKLTSADQFESIAHGLALIGQAEDPDQWAAAA